MKTQLFFQVGVSLVLLTASAGCCCRPSSYCAYYQNDHTFKLARDSYAKERKSGAVAHRKEWVEQLRSMLQDPGVVDEYFDFALQAVYCQPVTESPAYWADLVDNDALPPARRRMCLFALFNRHVRPGMSVVQFRETVGDRKWFTEKSLIDLAAYQAVPAQRPLGRAQFRLQLPFMESENSAVYLSFEYHYGSKAELMDLLNGKSANRRIRFAEFTVEQPRCSVKQ